MFGKLFIPNRKRETPVKPAGPSAQDIATDQRMTGAAIENMTERALASIRRSPVPQQQQMPVDEVSEGAVIEALTRAALPQSRQDARALLKAKADRIADEAAREDNWRKARAREAAMEF